MVLLLEIMNVGQILCGVSNYLCLLQTVERCCYSNSSNRHYFSSNPSNRDYSYLYPSDGWCSWTKEQTYACISFLFIYKEMDKKSRLFTTGGQSRNTMRTERRGRTRHTHSIPVPRWAVWCVKMFQLLSSMSTLLPSCLDAGIVGPVVWNKRLGKSSSWITF